MIRLMNILANSAPPTLKWCCTNVNMCRAIRTGMIPTRVRTVQRHLEPISCSESTWQCHRTWGSSDVELVGLRFSDLHHFRRHPFVHMGVKPYKDPTCQRGFSQSTDLKSHMHCDKCYNHNVSWMNHFQNPHVSSSKHAREKRNGTACVTV